MRAIQDLQAGQLTDEGIRYVMMRPDVLMGVAHELPPEDAPRFFKALENSAFRHAQASFSHYQSRRTVAAKDILSNWFLTAASLGWGTWSMAHAADGSHEIDVLNSPFAAGHGPSNAPVCGAITGVLKAMVLVAYGAVGDVREVACAAQGSPSCRFDVTPVRP